MEPTLVLLLNTVAAGLMLGGFYAAVTAGVSISFGMLDIVNIAHPALIVLGAFAVHGASLWLAVDPLLASLLLTPLFYAAGTLLYRVYHAVFERHGQEAIRGMAFFFGLMFVVEVGLTMGFGADFRFVQAAYIGPTLSVGPLDLPLRMLVPAALALAMIGGTHLFLTRSFAGRAILAVAQDHAALRLMAVDPARVKRLAFGLSVASAVVAGGLLLIIQPVDPSSGREFIGRVFAICVLGGLGSLPGTVLAALALGLVESLTATFCGPSWSPAIAFGFLLVTLAVRPAGLFGR